MRSAKITVRGATRSDLPNIERHYGPLDNIGDPFCDVTKIQKVRFDWLIIGEIAEKYAGFLYWHLGKKPFFAPSLDNFAHIREVQVLEKFQGQGIGRELTAYALNRLKALGTKDVFLATAESNDKARHLYESLGFTQFRKQIQYTLRINSSRKEVLNCLTQRVPLYRFKSTSSRSIRGAKLSTSITKKATDEFLLVR